MRDAGASSYPVVHVYLEHFFAAFSYDGLGILTVVNVPTLAEKRQALLPLARAFAELPADVKAKCVGASLYLLDSRRQQQK